MVVGREAAAQGHVDREHLAPAQRAAGQHDAALGHRRAVPGGGGLHEVPARLHRLDLRGRHLLGGDLGRAVGRRVGRHGEQLRPGPHGRVAAVRVEDLEADQEPERPGRCAHEPAPVPGDGIERDAGEVGEVGEEGAVGHVLAEGHPVHLLEHADDAAVGAPGHDLVAEGRGAHRRRHPDEQRRVQPAGQAGQERRLGRAGQWSVAGRPRPRATARGRGPGGRGRPSWRRAAPRTPRSGRSPPC